MRMYQTIWIKLLASPTKTLQLRCREQDQPRIIQAIFKEKAMDKKERKRWRFSYRRDEKTDILHLSLEKTLIGDIQCLADQQKAFRTSEV